MQESDVCPVCETESTKQDLGPLQRKHVFDCAMCGRFLITSEAAVAVKRLEPTERGRLSGVLLERKRDDTPVEIWENDIPAMLSQTPSDIISRLDGLLVNLSTLTKALGHRFFLDSKYRNLGYTLDIGEFKAQIFQLIQLGMLKEEFKSGQAFAVVSVSLEGLIRAKKLRDSGGWYSNKAFSLRQVFRVCAFHLRPSNLCTLTQARAT